MLGSVPWNPLPQMPPLPLIAHLIDHFKTCGPEEFQALQLDLYELGRYAEVEFHTNMVSWNDQMATHFHSCGNSLSGCPCGCRKYPFTEGGLKSGGLHGLLIQLEGVSKCGQRAYRNFRHISPDELALFNGMIPGLDWKCNPKMALCALGQLASPIQSLWIGSFIYNHLHLWEHGYLRHDDKLTLLKYMDVLLKHRDHILGPPTKPDSIAFHQKMVDARAFSISPPNPMNQV